MIREDRRQLNERFRKVFHLLEERGEIIKNDRNGRGIGDFAEKILGNRAYGHIIRAYLNEDDNRCIDYGQARILCQEYNVNESYMLDGEGTPFGMSLPSRPEVAEPAGGYRGNILFTTTEAFAGTTVGADDFDREEHTFFSLPGLSGGGLVAFPINGNSMEPVIQDGDIVICREIDSLRDIRDNRIYAVKHNGSLWVKYVQKIYDKNRVTHLRMISANHLEHDPFVEEVNEYTKLYEVVRRISDL